MASSLAGAPWGALLSLWRPRKEDAVASGAARTTMLPVAVASHTPLLTKASAAFRQELNEAPMPVEMPTGIRLLSGTDGAPIFDVRSGADK